MHLESERSWPTDDAAWTEAEKERFSLCLRCRSAPPKMIFSGFFCSSRCEEAFFGPASDWSAVYRQEVARSAGRSTPPARKIDGPETWGLRNFVRRGAYLDLPSGRSYARERRWPRAGLLPIHAPGSGLRPPIALGGRVGHLAPVEPIPPLPPRPALTRSALLPATGRNLVPTSLPLAERTTP